VGVYAKVRQVSRLGGRGRSVTKGCDGRVEGGRKRGRGEGGCRRTIARTQVLIAVAEKKAGRGVEDFLEG